MAKKTNPKGRSRSRQILIRLLALLLVLPLLVAVEGALRWLDVADPSRFADPFVGFSSVQPLFIAEPAAGEYRTAPARLSFFAPQAFAWPKPANGLRVFCFGGSTVLGHPYQPDTAFSTWLKLDLQGHAPGRAVEVVNCGGISYASYRLVPILREVLDYAPDLIVVATGHNEFLEDRTYQAIKYRPAAEAWIEDRAYRLRSVILARQALDRWRGVPDKPVLKDEVDAKLDHESGYASYHWDDKWRAGVVEHYRHNIAVMVRLCREANVPLVLVRLGSNLRDCPPFKSEHRADLSAAELAEWERVWAEAEQLETNNPNSALDLYRKAEELDEQYALLHYKIARCLDRLERWDEAKQAYVRAKEFDVCPLRIIEPVAGALEAIARSTATPLIDANAVIESHSANGIPGHDWYLDHVHPTIGGHQLIARELVEHAIERGLIKRSDHWTESARRAAVREQLDGLGLLYLNQGKVRVGWLNHWSRRDRLKGELVPHDARAMLDLGHAHLEFGEPEVARGYYREALQQDSSLADSLFHHAYRLFTQGRSSAAHDALEVLLDTVKEEAMRKRVSVALAVVRLDFGKEPMAAIVRARLLDASEKAAFDETWLKWIPSTAPD